mmetsp:Transcript_76011/g.180871  ORF Transcript_76011/g.180871 Transcript_76011/m.180871 type:complete len:253 (+) Transcript_76011:81-839(+)
MVQLDEAVLEKLVSFVAEPRARACCQSWAETLWDSLQLEYLILVRRHLAKHGMLSYHHSAVRSLGDDFDESVAYQFEFYPSGTYEVSWNRSFGQWSAANERQVGNWRVDGDTLACESIAGPEVAEGYVRYAPAGRCFALPVLAVLEGRSTESGKGAPAWEYQVRGAPVPEACARSLSCLEFGDEAEATSDRALHSSENLNVHVGRISEDAQFVEVDGDFHEVAADIRDTYPPEDWQRLMTCRVRFGIMGNMA